MREISPRDLEEREAHSVIRCAIVPESVALIGHLSPTDIFYATESERKWRVRRLGPERRLTGHGAKS